MYSQGAYNTALELFEGIQEDYPQSEKIMESILKAGFCHFELGNIDKSIQIFKQIIADYPNSSVARLASEKLDTINYLNMIKWLFYLLHLGYYSPDFLFSKGPLAQLVEQLAFNQLVEGSNPSRPTI